MTGSGGQPLAASILQLSGGDVLQYLHHLSGLGGHGQGGGVHLLQGVSYVVVVEDDERLAQGGGEPGVEGGVPLLVFVTEPDD